MKRLLAVVLFRLSVKSDRINDMLKSLGKLRAPVEPHHP